MEPSVILSVVAGYFAVLVFISFLTTRKASADAFFTGDRQSPWYLVAFGMIGASLSGITFISIPGWVAGSQFSYMQMVLGYIVGYAIISFVLMPLYYRLNLTSIYEYLGQRFDINAQKTGATFFLISRVLGASLRLYLVVLVLQRFVFDALGVDFAVTTFISIALIWIYTFKGGIKTVVWSDTLQTLFMLLSLGITLVVLSDKIGADDGGMMDFFFNGKSSQIFFFDDFKGKSFFFKQFIGGAVLAICMTGLDQDMMQKNLTCRTLKGAQTNMMSFSVVLVFVNAAFLLLGAYLFGYLDQEGLSIPTRMVAGEPKAATDLIFPSVAMEHINGAAGIIFVIGLIAAAYSSADSALTSLTTSFCVDFLGGKVKPGTRKLVHLGASFVLFVTIVIFYKWEDDSAVSTLFRMSTYTYGPLLGLFAFGIVSKSKVDNSLIIPICIAPPVICYVLNEYSVEWLGGYQFGFEMLLVNGILTYLGLLLIRKNSTTTPDLDPSIEV